MVPIKEEPELRTHESIRYDVNLYSFHFLTDLKLLIINFGTKASFFPAEKYQIFLPGSKDTLRDHLTVIQNGSKISFKLSAEKQENPKSGDKPENNPILLSYDEVLEKYKIEDSKLFKSTGAPGYTIKREGDNFLFTNHHRNLEYLFATSDGGSTWLLKSVRSKLNRSIRISCKYNFRDELTSIRLPNGKAYTIDYENGLACKVTDPLTGLVHIIEWENGLYVKSLKTYLQPKHPLYPETWPGTRPKPILIRSILVKCDEHGRILSFINSFGERYTGEYREERDDTGKTRYLCAIMTKPDGTKQFESTTVEYRSFSKGHSESRGERCLVQKGGKLVTDKNGVEKQVVNHSAVLRKKMSSYVPYLCKNNGSTTRYIRESNSLAPTAVEDSRGRRTSFGYSDIGLKSKTIAPNGFTQTIEYDDEYRIRKRISKFGETEYIYKDHLLHKLVSNRRETVYEYRDGLIFKERLRDKTFHKFEWDGLMRLKKHSWPDKHVSVYDYYGNANVLKSITEIHIEKDGTKKKQETLYYYTPQGFLKKIIHPDKSYEVAYYDNGLITMFVNRDKQRWKQIYSGNRSLVMKRLQDGLKGTTYTYYPDGKTDRIIKPDGTFTQYIYDHAGRIAKIIHPDKSWETRSYNCLGRILKKRYSDRTCRIFEYDCRGRMIIRGGNSRRTAFNNTGR